MGYSWGGPSGGVDENGKPFRFKAAVPPRICCDSPRFGHHVPECLVADPEAKE